MIDIKYKVGGQLVNPVDFQDLVIRLDWLNRKQEPSVNIEELTFKGSDGVTIKKRLLNGLTGGVGVFEGESASIEVIDGTNSTEFAGYLDFTSGLNVTNQCEITASFKKEQGTDWLNDVAEGFSYRFLYSEGVITDSDFIDVPYVINYIPDGVQLILLAQATFTLTKELVENIKAVGEGIADLTNAATPVLGVSAAGPVVSYDIGDIIAAALKLTLQIAYTIAIAIAIGSLISQIIEQLMPPVRYKKGMPLRLLFQKACDYLGLNLVSTLLDDLDTSAKKYIYLPQKGNGLDDLGVPTQGSILDTFAGVIRTFKDVFNADFKLVNGTLYFERKDSFTNASSYVIPNTFINQTALTDNFSLNTDEILANYNINFATDLQDQNTLDDQEGRVYQVQTLPKRTNNTKLVNLKGFREVQIPLALATRKNGLTTIEEIIKGLATAADFLTGQLGQPSSLSGQINNRVGSMNLSSNFTNTDKLLVMNGAKLLVNQRNELNAKNVWDRYHFINSFVPNNGEHNQYWIYKEQQIPFCFQDFVSLSNGADIETIEGEKAEIETLDWTPYDGKATISYRVNRLYTTNLEEKTL